MDNNYMIRKIKIQKPKMPISLNNCDDAINEILDYEKLEEALVENTTIDGIENLSVRILYLDSSRILYDE